MDEAVTEVLAATAAQSAKALAMALLLAAGAQAQALRDPTRPPAAGLASGAAPVSAVAGPRLQSILVGREAGGRRLAVIDGDTVRQGEQFHGARVARIGGDEVELVRGGEHQVLRLYVQDTPGVTPARAHAAVQVLERQRR